MACERVAHPYLEHSTGLQKHAGTVGGGVSCARVDVTSNVPNVPIEVSDPDDLERQDGKTSFCRQYDETCPLTVTFTAPQFAGIDNEREFRVWRVNGVEQEEFQLAVTVDPCRGECVDLKASYGAVFTHLCDDCNGPEGAMQLPQTITVRAPINVIGGQCWRNGNCTFLAWPHTPPSCWNQLWESAAGHNFQLEFEGPGEPPSNVCGARWTGSRILHPNPNPDLPADQCWPNSGCNTPAVDCMYSPQCYICWNRPRQRVKTWVMTEGAIVELYIWNPPAQQDFVMMTWFAAARKTFCMKTDDDEDAACDWHCAQQGGCECDMYQCAWPQQRPASRRIAPPVHTFDPFPWSGIHTQIPFSSDWQGLHPDAPLLSERISNHKSCMHAAQFLLNNSEFLWSGSILTNSYGDLACTWGWNCDPIEISLEFGLNF